jgi:hypothetical protein
MDRDKSWGQMILVSKHRVAERQIWRASRTSCVLQPFSRLAAHLHSIPARRKVRWLAMPAVLVAVVSFHTKARAQNWGKNLPLWFSVSPSGSLSTRERMPCVLTTRPFTWCQTPKTLARNVSLVAWFGILRDFFFLGPATDSVCTRNSF